MVDNPYKYPYVPIGGIIEWDGTGLTGAPDLSTPEKVAAVYGYGTWERYGVDRVTVGAGGKYTAGSTGGEKEHTLTESELPKIDGAFATNVVSDHSSVGVTGHAYGVRFDTVPSKDRITTTIGDNGSMFGYGYKFGSGKAHNNMQPYIGTYKYRRIA